MLVTGLCALFVLFFLVRASTSSPIGEGVASTPYNDKYPLTKPEKGVRFRIAIISDMDEHSKHTSDGETMWISYLKQGNLTRIGKTFNIEWDSGSPVKLQSNVSERGRGMELSELITFNGRLLTIDDRTGWIYAITKSFELEKFVRLKENDTDDDSTAKGYKAEWGTVKDDHLIVGSMGREWRLKGGVVKNRHAMNVKRISPAGFVETLDWRPYFERLREKSCQITDKGYMTHESGVWSPKKRRWFFMPRKCSPEEYDEIEDEENGCNVLIKADDNFKNIETVILYPNNSQPTHGFASFKFIPGTEDEELVALKTVEHKDKTETYIVVLNLNGQILLEEQLVSSTIKYEGIEFI